jgi:hypothetical protein
MTRLSLLPSVAAAIVLIVGACSDSGEHASSSGGGGGQGGEAGAGGVAGLAGSDAGPFGCTKDDECFAQIESASPPGCASAFCDVDVGTCSYAAADADGDGHATNECAVDGVGIQVGDDCNDADFKTYPGAWDGPLVVGDPNRPNRCNGKDENCNGSSDESVTASGASCECDPAEVVDCAERPDGTKITFPGGVPKGACQLGTKQCVNGKSGACLGAIEPKSTDSCTKPADENCDGKLTCSCTPGATSTCGVAYGALGACASLGIVCQSNGTWPACPKKLGDDPEVCDTAATDEDCDGDVNETCQCVSGSTEACTGATGCTSTHVCANGAWTVCNAPQKTCPSSYVNLSNQCTFTQNIPSVVAASDALFAPDALMSSWLATAPTYGGTPCVSLKLSQTGSCSAGSGVAMNVFYGGTSYQDITHAQFASGSTIQHCGVTQLQLKKIGNWGPDASTCERSITNITYENKLPVRCPCGNEPSGQSCF